MVFQFWYDGASIGRSLGEIRPRRTNFFMYNFKVSLYLIHFNQEKFYELYCFNEFLFFKSIFHFFSSQSKWPFTQEIFNDFWFSDAMYCHHRMLFSHFSKSETEPEKRASPHEQVSVQKLSCVQNAWHVYVMSHFRNKKVYAWRNSLECPNQCQHRSGHSFGKKCKMRWKTKKILGFSKFIGTFYQVYNPYFLRVIYVATIVIVFPIFQQ